jgi:hypothetical protein
MATHSKSKTCQNAVDHKPILIKVEFDKPITTHRNSGIVGATLYVLSCAFGEPARFGITQVYWLNEDALSCAFGQ